MTTPTLDEIEAELNAVQWIGERDYRAPLLALVAHVRALENITRMTDDKALERIATLERKKLPPVVMRRVAAVHGHGDRITALEERAAALEAHCGAQLKLHHDALAREVNTEVLVGQEMEIARLREENAELREKLAKTAEALDNTRQTSFRTAQELRAENAELKRARPEPSRGS